MKTVKLLIDPGHDKAKYNQSPVVPSYYEGERMWRLYQFLRPALERRGIIVGCTKSKCDQAVTVTQRGAMARGYDGLVSLHSNACNDKRVNRPVGIYFVDDGCGPIDDTSKDLAELLSKVTADVMGTTQAQIYSRLSKNDRDHDGKKNDDHYGVLYAAHQAGVPATIIEHSFHTNKEAALWLLDDDNLKELAEAEAAALAEYYGVIGSTETTAPTTSTTTKKEGTKMYMKTLREGDTGPQVVTLQRYLRGCSEELAEIINNSGGDDGIFGSGVKKAVKVFQSQNKDTEGEQLREDGVWGPKCWGVALGQ